MPQTGSYYITAKNFGKGFIPVPGLAPNFEDNFNYSNGDFGVVAVPPWSPVTSCSTVNTFLVVNSAIKMNTGGGGPLRRLDIVFPSSGNQNVQDVRVEMTITISEETGLAQGRFSGGPMCRSTGGANPGHYLVIPWFTASSTVPNRMRIIRGHVHGAACPSDTTLLEMTPSSSLIVGDVIGISAVGINPTVLTAFLNGVQVGQTSDSDSHMQVALPIGLARSSTISGGGVNGRKLTFDDYKAFDLTP